MLHLVCDTEYGKVQGEMVLGGGASLLWMRHMRCVCEGSDGGRWVWKSE